MTRSQVAALTLLILGAISQVTGTIITAVELRGVWWLIHERLRQRVPMAGGLVEAHSEAAAALATAFGIGGRLTYGPIDHNLAPQAQIIALDAEFRGSHDATQSTLEALAKEDRWLREQISGAKSESLQAVQALRDDLREEQRHRRGSIALGVGLIILGTLLLTAGGIVAVLAPPTAS